MGSVRMALSEAAKALPWGAVWQYFCEKNNIPQDWDVINPIREYEKPFLSIAEQKNRPGA